MKRMSVLLVVLSFSSFAFADTWNAYIKKEPKEEWTAATSETRTTIEPWPEIMMNECGVQLWGSNHAVKVINKGTGEERTALCAEVRKARDKAEKEKLKSRPAVKTPEQTIELWGAPLPRSPRSKKSK